MSGLVWKSAPSPQPSPHGGEGVVSCSDWAVTSARSDGNDGSAAPLHRKRYCAYPLQLGRPIRVECLFGKAQTGLIKGCLVFGFVWDSTPSPQPSPQRGEGVVSCSDWAAAPARSTDTPIDRTRFWTLTRRADGCHTTPLPRLTPSSPRPFGERARVRGNVLKATQEPQQ